MADDFGVMARGWSEVCPDCEGSGEGAEEEGWLSRGRRVGGASGTASPVGIIATAHMGEVGIPGRRVTCGEMQRGTQHGGDSQKMNC